MMAPPVTMVIQEVQVSLVRKELLVSQDVLEQQVRLQLQQTRESRDPHSEEATR